MIEAAAKAKKTGVWAKIMAKWLITFSSRGSRKVAFGFVRGFGASASQRKPSDGLTLHGES
jgi:hypothetical protein